MELIFTGCGSAFAPELGNTSAYFIENNELYIIDMGELVFSALKERLALASFKQIHVLITHLHADHVGSLATLISYMHYVHGKKIKLYHPERTLVSLLALQDIPGVLYDLDNSLQGSTCSGSYRFYPTAHSAQMRAYGILLQTPESACYYSGDSASIPEAVIKGFNTGSIQLLYQDVSSKAESAGHHMYIGKLAELFTAEQRQRIFCMHFDRKTAEIALSKGFNTVSTEGGK